MTGIGTGTETGREMEGGIERGKGKGTEIEIEGEMKRIEATHAPRRMTARSAIHPEQVSLTI